MEGVFKELFTIAYFRRNTLILIVCWSSVSFNYYLVNFLLQFIEGSIYNNSIASSMSDVISILFSGMLLSKLGLKLSFVIYFLLATAGGVLYLIFGADHPEDVAIIILIAKFGVSAAFNLVYIANAVLYPPSLAATAMGICNIFARIATVLAPEIAEIP